MQGSAKQEIKKKFGGSVTRARKLKKLSLRDLAALADMEHKHLEKIEKGEVNPTLTTIFQVAGALDIKPTDLIDGMGPVEN